MAQSWFVLRQEAERTIIEFQPQPQAGYWEPSVLWEYPLPRGEFCDRRVLLTGRGAVWMYAHAAAVLSAEGARQITISKPLNEKGMMPQGHGFRETFSPENFYQLTSKHISPVGSVALVKLNVTMDRPLPEDESDQLVAHIGEKLEAIPTLAELYLTGSASVEIYARIAHRAVQCGVPRIVCVSPRDGYVSVWPVGSPINQIDRVVMEWTHGQIAPRRHVALGVVGDPNCGKSVLSRVFYYAAKRAGYWSWRFDSDGQSPTPEWYLTLSRTAPREAKKLRDEQKIPWSSEMEASLADHLKTARNFLEILIVDLPGGDHRVSPPQRIPPGRERIFEKLDRIVIVYRREGSPAPWREALDKIDLSGRIVAEITSCNPQALPRFNLIRGETGLWQGEATGLDRQTQLDTLLDVFYPPLRDFWPDLLGKNPMV